MTPPEERCSRKTTTLGNTFLASCQPLLQNNRQRLKKMHQQYWQESYGLTHERHQRHICWPWQKLQIQWAEGQWRVTGEGKFFFLLNILIRSCPVRSREKKTGEEGKGAPMVQPATGIPANHGGACNQAVGSVAFVSPSLAARPPALCFLCPIQATRRADVADRGEGGRNYRGEETADRGTELAGTTSEKKNLHLL